MVTSKEEQSSPKRAAYGVARSGTQVGVRLPEVGGGGRAGPGRWSRKEEVFGEMRFSFKLWHVRKGNSWFLQAHGFPRKQIPGRSNDEGVYSEVANQ